jgi:hypothetical protein
VRWVPVLFVPAVLLGQATPQTQGQRAGTLMYRTPQGRAVTFVVEDAGHPAFVRLKAEAGDAGELRTFVLAHAGLERMIAPGAKLLKEKAPSGWKVDHNRTDQLVEAGGVTYWRYSPSLVVPVRFSFGKASWSLLAADLPPRMLISTGE